MLARLKNAIFRPPVPSVVLAVGKPDDMIYFVHIVPEDGTIETVGYTSRSPTFRFHGTTEQTREHLGTVTVYAEDSKGAFTFLRAAAERALESWDGPWLSSLVQERTDNARTTTQPASGGLYQGGAGAIPSRNGRACSVNATRAGNVDVVTQLEAVLRQAALDIIHDREARPPSENVQQTCPVFVIRVNRPKSGTINPAEPRTFG